MAGIKKTYMKLKEKAYGKRGVKGRYYRVGAAKGLQNLAKDIEMIKGRLNVEKKDVRSDVVTTFIGQVDGNSDGAYVADLTQAINQGIGETQRIGNSLKCTGMSMPIQLTGQLSNYNGGKVRITMLRVRTADNDVSGTEAFEKVWEINPLTGVRDFNAPRAYRNSKTDGIAVVRSKVCYLPKRTGPNSSSFDENFMTETLRFSVKLDDVWRYSTNSDTLPSGLKYYLVFQVDAGNASTSTVSTLDVPITRANSGIELRLAQRTWFVDN